jgi:lysophospholipase L1-like esterase
MNRLPIFFAALALIGSTFAKEAPAVWPSATNLPEVPAGATLTTFPAPRDEWFVRVGANIRKGQAEAEKIQLIFDGDSITDGWQHAGQQIWAERYAKYGAIDFGISGDRTEHVLWRLAQGQAKGAKPRLIAIMIGTNNIRRDSAGDIAVGVKAVVEEYQKICPGATILLQAIFPRGELADNPDRVKIAEINRMIAKLDDGKHVVFVDFGDKFLNPDGSMSKEIMPDFLHPSPKGYQIWAEAIQPLIDKYLAAIPAAN